MTELLSSISGRGILQFSREHLCLDEGTWLSDFGFRSKFNYQVWKKLVVNVFLYEVKKGRWHPDKILVPWDVCVNEVCQEVAVAFLVLSLEYAEHDPGIGWLSSSPGSGCGLGCAGGCRVFGGGWFKCVLLCLSIKMQIKILNSIKTKSTLS